jgi:hypothetical protein
MFILPPFSFEASPAINLEYLKNFKKLKNPTFSVCVDKLEHRSRIIDASHDRFIEKNDFFVIISYNVAD